MRHPTMISRDSILAAFGSYSRTVESIRSRFAAIDRDPCAPQAARAAAARIDVALDDPVLAITLTTADWDVLRATYLATVNALKLAEGFGHRIGRSDLIALAREAECILWILVWRRLVHVDGLSDELAHIRLTSVDQHFRNEGTAPAA